MTTLQNIVSLGRRSLRPPPAYPAPIIAPCAGRLTMNQRPPSTRFTISSPGRMTLFSSQDADFAENFPSCPISRSTVLSSVMSRISERCSFAASAIWSGLIIIIREILGRECGAGKKVPERQPMSPSGQSRRPQHVRRTSATPSIATELSTCGICSDGPRLCEKGFVSARILSRRRFCDYGTPICAESTL